MSDPLSDDGAPLMSTSYMIIDLPEVEYNVIEILNNSGKVGSDIVKAFGNSNEETVSSEDRIKIVQICVDYLLSLPLEKKWYPTSEMKLKMAKGITTAFPCLAYAWDRLWRAFYDSDVQGYIDQRLVQSRKNSQDDRKRKNEKVSDEKKKYEKRPKGYMSTDDDLEQNGNFDDVQYKVNY